MYAIFHLFTPYKIAKIMKKSCLLILLYCYFSLSFAGNRSDTLLIKKHLQAITQTENYRNYQNIKALNQVADYIFSEFQLYADTVYFQAYKVNGTTYKNVVCVFGSQKKQPIVVGAHYDVCGEQEGADDNASGVVALLELARLLHNQNPNHRIELVAYTLEEPPFFRTKNMGSYVHAKSLVEQKIPIYGMIAIEMIGCFKEAKHSQDYPIGLLSLIYGNKGNFITLVNKFGKGKFARNFSTILKRKASMKTRRFVGPKALTGIDFSDHLNYWHFGISALMITDTAFYRNKSYHEKGDKIAKLHIPNMAKIIDDICRSLLTIK